jgi:hypothetical protein
MHVLALNPEMPYSTPVYISFWCRKRGRKCCEVRKRGKKERKGRKCRTSKGMKGRRGCRREGGGRREIEIEEKGRKGRKERKERKGERKMGCKDGG